MGKPGPKPKPVLQVVREGNPGKRTVPEGIKLPPVDGLPEPDWAMFFPEIEPPVEGQIEDAELRYLARSAAGGSERCRTTATVEWRRVVPQLIRSVGLSDVDLSLITDYCVTIARLRECERRISIDGLVVMGQRGQCRHPLTSVAAQYRTQLKTYIGELGLSPSARGGMEPPRSDDENDPFDN